MEYSGLESSGAGLQHSGSSDSSGGWSMSSGICPCCADERHHDLDALCQRAGQHLALIPPGQVTLLMIPAEGFSQQNLDRFMAREYPLDPNRDWWCTVCLRAVEHHHPVTPPK